MKRTVIVTGSLLLVVFIIALYRYKTSPDTYYNIGLDYQKKRMYASAVVEFNRAVERDPSLGKAWVGLGTAYIQRGMHQQAIEEFQKGLKFNPAYADLWYNLGMLHLSYGHYQEAVQKLQEALRLAPDQLKKTIHFSLAYALSQSGQIDRAIGEYRTGMAIDSTAAEPHLFLAILYTEKGKLH